MASIIRLCPLSGGAGEETPHCYVLEVDQFTFRLDRGWDPNFSQDIAVPLKQRARHTDAGVFPIFLTCQFSYVYTFIGR